MRRISSISLALLTALVAVAAPSSAEPTEVVRLRVADTIQPASQRYIDRGLKQAAELGAALVVVELDTPGGLVDTTREITTAITESKVPVAVFVTPGGARAASAGFFILISADIAAMAPGTNTGAAHPVEGGKNLEGDMRDKATNDLAAMVRAISKQRGRNEELSVKAVTESASFAAEEALKDGLVDLLAKDMSALLEQLNGREITRFDKSTVTLDLKDATVVDVMPTQAERFLSVLANPNIAYLLMALGMLGIWAEITHPGAILPGVVGVISILLALYSLSVLPVNLAGVGLILFGLVLFVLEVKVTSYGLLSVAGIVSFILGSLMLFDAPIPDMRVSLGVVVPTAVIMAAVVVFLLTRVLRTHRLPPLTGVEGLVGEVGHALSDLAPVGKVLVHGEYWDAYSPGGAIATGSEVKIISIQGRRLEVGPADSTAQGG